ncbi:MAG: phage tail protein [Myxococcota bacterium]
MGEWTGRGKGRNPGQPSNTFKGGKGAGGGRPGSQPTLSISGGAGKGGGRPGSQPSLSISGGAGRGGGRSSANNPTLDISGGEGRGGGRSSNQPSLSASTSIELPGRSFSLKAAVDFGGSSAKSYSIKSSTSKDQRAGSTIKSSSGESNPRVADPEGNFIFTLEISGIEVAQFKECSGLKSTTDVFELQEGGVNHTVHKLPGQTRWDNIVLRAGVTSDTSLMAWRDEILQDDFGNRRNGSIVMKTLQMEEVRRYNFVNAWPVAWEGPSFDAGGADLAVEMLEIAHHGVYVT